VNRGYFVAFEGNEGSGKTTQLHLLADVLEQAGNSVVRTREPGGTQIGETIRSILLADTFSGADPRTEALLHTAARAEHVARVICPAMMSGSHVLSDRFSDSTLAYQGGGSGLTISALRELQRFAVRDCEPDLRILLRVDVEDGLMRRFVNGQDINRVDLHDLDFHRRVAATFDHLASESPAEWIVIDAGLPVPDVHDAIRRAVADRLPDLRLMSAHASTNGEDQR
jgi:dTMP kinase